MQLPLAPAMVGNIIKQKPIPFFLLYAMHHMGRFQNVLKILNTSEVCTHHELYNRRHKMDFAYGACEENQIEALDQHSD